jgi:pyruvate dehydrogenase (quinone)
MTTVAESMVRALSDAGVRRVYGIAGDSLNGFTDALRRQDDVAWTQVRHEEAAAFAASGDAGLTGELAVCAGSCGPGNLHLINGLYDAQRSRVPVVAIAAHIPREEIGSEYFQETHPTELFRECSVYCEMVMTPENAPRILAMAMRAAVEERGVAVVVVSGEVLLGEASNEQWLQHPIRPTSSRIVPDEAALDEAAVMIDQAKSVTLLVGAGIAGARDEVLAFAAATRAPIVHALRGKELIEHDNPFDVGMTGLLGFASGYKALKEGELLVMLGTDFPYPQFYPDDARVIQVDVRGRNIGRRTPVDLPLVGTVKDTLQALLPRIVPKTSDRHLDAARKHYAKTREGFDRIAESGRSEAPMLPEALTATVSAKAAADAVFTVDVGSPTLWAARYLRLGGGRRLIGSFNHGSMAGALSQAIGVQSAEPERQVIALAGDGGLTMLFGELLTLTQQKLPVKVVVYDNASLNFVELEMKAAGIVNYGTGLDDPDLSLVASALGMFGARAETLDELDDALDRALAHPGPALVDARVARQELAIPPSITAKQATGFGLFAMRTVLSGKGDELLDLFTTNVARRLLR